MVTNTTRIGLIVLANGIAGSGPGPILAVGVIITIREVVFCVGWWRGNVELLRCTPILDQITRIGTSGALLFLAVGAAMGMWGLL